ncbi:MAG: sterol desaturase family protein [Stellaceae bacterium]
MPALIATSGLTLLEYAFPGADGMSVNSRLRGVALRIAILAVGTVVQALLIKALELHPVAPLLRVHVAQWLHSGGMAVRTAGWVGVYFASMLFIEFWMYWFHRLQHAIPFLWGFHRVHHSIRELNALNSTDHLSDPIFATPFAVLPTVFILGFDAGPWPFALALLANFHGFYVHSSTRLNFGPLRYLFVDARHHRVHHSLNPAHFDKNFGGRMPFWDVVFGTVHFPRRDEKVAVGMADLSPPDFRAFIAIPWRAKLQTEAAVPFVQ